MIKIYLTILSIVLTITTIAIGILKPEINKSIEFSVSEFKLISTENPIENISTPNVTPVENIEIQNTENFRTKKTEQNIKPEKIKETTKIIEQKPPIATKNIEVQSPKTPIKTSEKSIKTAPPKSNEKPITLPQPETSQKEVLVELPNSITNIVQNLPQPPVAKTDANIQKEDPITVQTQQKPIPLPKIESKPIEQMTPDEIIKQAEKEDRYLTEREEIVVWNVWRSNLQNQIMKDSQVSAPLGTAFKFSFTVDSKGRISNLRTWAIPSIYNNVAVNYLKPLIQSYTGKPILTFPSRTKRVITNVTGGFTISTEDKFSTPEDFSDIERIKTTR